MSKQVLIVGNDGVQLYLVKGKTVSLYRDFSDAGGSFSSELRKAFRANGLPLIILYDVVEQQYRKEPIPKVGFLDKNKVIKRRLQMAFPQQQMLAYLPLKQKPKENESMVALFAGLATNLTITQIMDAVIGSEVSLDGAGLLPLESTSLVTKIITEVNKRAKTTSNTRWSVLMTHHKTGGLRQIVIKDGELALTRLTPLSASVSKAANLAEEMIREFNATLTYLSRFGYIPSDGLDLIVVDAPEVCDQFRNYTLPVTNFYPLTAKEAGNLVGMKVIANSDDIFSEIIHAGWVGIQRKLTVPLTAPMMDSVKNARQIAKVLIVAGFFGMLYLGYQCVNTYFDLQTVQSEIDEQNTRVLALQHENDELNKKMNSFPNDPELSRTMLAVYDHFNKAHLDVEPTINAIMSVVQRDKINIKSLKVEPFDATKNAGGAATPPPAPVPVVTNPDGTIVPPVEEKPKVVIELTFGFPADVGVEEAARRTKDLMARLSDRLPGRDISIAKMVGNLALDQTVQGISEQVTEGVKGEEVDDGTSGLTITGALE